MCKMHKRQCYSQRATKQKGRHSMLELAERAKERAKETE
jgi:hypothetical protein